MRAGTARERSRPADLTGRATHQRLGVARSCGCVFYLYQRRNTPPSPEGLTMARTISPIQARINAMLDKWREDSEREARERNAKR